MASTYTPIATTTLGSAAASYTFSSISGAYTDLILVINALNASTDSVLMQVGNGSVDTGANYSNTRLEGNGSAASSGRASNVTYCDIGYGNNNQALIVQLMNYSNTTSYKSVLNRYNDTANVLGAKVNLWRSTSAINTIKIYNYGGTNFGAGSTFTLYGIKAA